MGKPNEEKAAVAEPEAVAEATDGDGAGAGRGTRGDGAQKADGRKQKAEGQAYGGDAEIRALDVEKLEYSPTNPRKHFDHASLLELAKSFGSVGVIAPPVVRPVKGKAGRYEIVVGERRVRAAKLGGVKGLTCVVREMSDEAVLRVQIVENLQREDVNPIEEAEGYQTLVQKGGYVLENPDGSPKLHPVTHSKLPDVERIAKEIGKSPRYVYDRLQLARRLIKPVIEATMEGFLTASHAVELARLEPAQQAECFSVIFEGTGYRESEREKPEDLLKELREEHKAPRGQGFMRFDAPLSVRGLQEYITDEIQRKLSKAPFDVNAVTLCPDAGACWQCHKRTDYELGKTELGKNSECLDPVCFEAKRKAHVKAVIAKEKERSDDVVVVSKQRTWHGDVMRANGTTFKPAKASDDGAVKVVDKKTGTATYAKPVKEKAGERKKTPEELEREREKLTEKVKLEDAFRKELGKAIAAKLVDADLLNVQDVDDLLDIRVGTSEIEILAPVFKWRVPKPFNTRTFFKDNIKDVKTLLRLAWFAAHVKTNCPNEWQLDHNASGLAAAKRFKVDVDACREKAKAQIAGVAVKKPEEKAPKNMKEWAAKQTSKAAPKKKAKAAKKGKKK